MKTTLLYLVLLVSASSFAQDFFWVGNSGAWSDYSNHWATTSGGSTFHASVPTNSNNVYFDANSFDTDGQIIDIDMTANCNDMDWTGVTNTPLIDANIATEDSLCIYGNLTFTNNVNKNLLRVLLYANNVDNNIYTGETNLGSFSQFQIWADGTGSVNLMDSLRANYITMCRGTFNTNNHPINCAQDFSFYSDSDSKIVNLGSSNLHIKTWNALNTSNLTLNAETSTIYSTNASRFRGRGFTYNDVIIYKNGVCMLEDNNTFNTLTILAGTSIELDDNSTQTVNQLIVNGAEGDSISFYTETAGVTATISQATGTVDGTYLKLQDNIATGGAVFNAFGSNDMGNNTGWNIIATLPMAGIYTIGGTSPDFTTITDAITALETNGISDNVTFNIRDGVYTEQLTIPAVTGVSASASVTFTSESADNSLVTIQYGAIGFVDGSTDGTDNWVVKLDNCSYINFENLTIKSEGAHADLGVVIRADGDISHISFIGNHIIGNGTSPDYYIAQALFQIREYAGLVDDLVLDNNTLENGKYYILSSNAINSSFTNNNFALPSSGGFYFSNVENLIFNDNIASGSLTIRDAGTGDYNIKVERNLFTDGITIRNMYPNSGYTIDFNNNTAHNLTLWGVSEAYVFHNTLSFQLRVASTTNHDIFLANNIIQSTSGNPSIDIEDISNINYLDYNNVYGPTDLFAQDIAGVTTNYTSLADWQTATGFSANSFSQELTFIGDMPKLCVNQEALVGTDMSIATDFEGDTRTQPVIGADEFTQITFVASASQTTIDDGDEITLTATDMLGGIVTWYDGNSDVIGTGLSLLYTASISEQITAEWFNGNCTEEITFDITSTVGIGDVDQNIFNIYPNPANNFIIVERGDLNIEIIEILDITGKIVKQVSVQNTKQSINISELNQGIYFVKVNQQLQKFVKK